MVTRGAMHINNTNEICWPIVFLMACVINFKKLVLLAVLTDCGKGKLRWLEPVKHPVIGNDITCLYLILHC